MATAVEQRTGFITLEAARQIEDFWINGSPVDLSTWHRWCARGVRGRRLRSAVLGGRRVVRRDWLDEFFEQLVDGEGVALPEHRTPTQRERQITSAEMETADIP